MPEKYLRAPRSYKDKSKYIFHKEIVLCFPLLHLTDGKIYLNKNLHLSSTIFLFKSTEEVLLQLRDNNPKVVQIHYHIFF